MLDTTSWVLPDVTKPGLRVLFCGTAPGRMSAARQAYYAHPQNKFWRILHEAGFTPRRFRPEEYAELLDLGIGLTDIAKTVSGNDNELPAGSLGRDRTDYLRQRVEECRPAVLAFTCLTGAGKFLRRSKIVAGEQAERVGETRIWALPSPSPKAGWNWSPEPWQALAAEISVIRPEC